METYPERTNLVLFFRESRYCEIEINASILNRQDGDSTKFATLLLFFHFISVLN